MAKKILGIDLGGTSIKFAIVSQTGELLEKWSIATNILEEGSHIIPDMIQSIQDHLALYQLGQEDFIGIGMGSPGAVDAKEGTVIGAYNLNWSKKQEVKKAFESAFSIPFFIENDANVAALGEQWMGAGNGRANVVMFTLGTGVGGGIVVDHKLIRGFGGCAGEVGHLSVVEDPAFQCTCGKKGCLETVASATGLVNLARHYAQSYAGDSQIKVQIDDGEMVSAKEIFEAAKAGDRFAEIVVNHFCHYLGLACSHVAHILNPQIIVIGGGVSAAGDYLLTKVKEHFEVNCFKQVKESTQIALATLGNDAGLFGAAQLVRLESQLEE
ncbi:ROK family glucokinase [Vaginisenegalia massiliensis]|uniref:ROK family glucokinase n=1 Tax=Vaginisenegalia massiliensis TaxID=2058294 RepID=UPI000F547F28|nr:ROK family glucokinase [Vaginisenegalia massiliensis]